MIKKFLNYNNKNMEEEIIYGCLWTGEEATDYVLCDGDIDILPKLYKQDEIRFEYNQANQSWSKVSCTIFSAMWMLSDLMNYEFSLDELQEVDELSYTKWRIRWHGWYVKQAVDLVCKWWNEKHGDLWKVAYYRVSKYSDMVDQILEKWYTINGNFCPTAEYSQDYRKDAVLDWTEFWTNTNGHAIDIIWNNWKRSTKDSYKWRKTSDWRKDCNRYELKHKLSELSNYGMWYYVFTKVAEDNLEELKRLNEIKAKINEIMPINSQLRHLTNSEPYKNKLHEANNMLREWLDYINWEIINLS